MIRQAIAGMALMVAASGQAATGDREFSEWMLERLQAASPGIDMRVSAGRPLVIEMAIDGDWDHASELNLRTFRAFCAEATVEECESFVSKMMATVREFTPAPPPATADLRVLVRHVRYLDELRERLPPGERQLSRPIGEDLIALLVFADADGATLATRGQVQALGLTSAEAWRMAREQTLAGLPELPPDTDLAKHVVAFGGYDFVPSLLINTEGWRAVAQKAGPDLFVTVSSDVAVWAGVMADGPQLEDFKQGVRAECAAADPCVSPNIYRFRDGRWVIAD